MKIIDDHDDVIHIVNYGTSISLICKGTITKDGLDSYESFYIRLNPKEALELAEMLEKHVIQMSHLPGEGSTLC